MSAGFRLPAGTGICRVRLRVRNLERSLAFYLDLLGLRLIEQQLGRACLSATGAPPALLVLEEDPAAVPKPPRTTGLYHFAILFPDRHDLARAFLRLSQHRWPFHGFSDHLVSEAIYLPDPDGNGIELYADRPRSAWPRRDGRLVMGTYPLDMDNLLASLQEERAGTVPATAEPTSGSPARGGTVPPGTVIGHIHLHVADLAAAETFYAGALGFEVTVRDYPGALFFAAGGYHHHVGVNVWAGPGAPRPPERAVGLLDFSLRLPDRDALRQLVAHLPRLGKEPRPCQDAAPPAGGVRAWEVRDPDGHTVLLEGPQSGGPAPYSLTYG